MRATFAREVRRDLDVSGCFVVFGEQSTLVAEGGRHSEQEDDSAVTARSRQAWEGSNRCATSPGRAVRGGATHLRGGFPSVAAQQNQSEGTNAARTRNTNPLYARLCTVGGGSPELISQWEALVRELQDASSGHVRVGSTSDEKAMPKGASSQADVLQSIHTLREELSNLTALVNRPHPMAMPEGDCAMPLYDFQAVERRAQELKSIVYPTFPGIALLADGSNTMEENKESAAHTQRRRA
ncbi:hypothetical protein HPB49_021274 [Dermacentor silvarum]|uniref:Uncharacterized protein n=1 Tax=Dermacentor silvarum TaxID=543639 RepID=A0ACB8CHG4_DERSI|nr:hypothetical protein HPB49_021274 [Dermacentor silvarum]